MNEHLDEVTRISEEAGLYEQDYEWVYFGVICPYDNYARPHCHQVKPDSTLGPVIVTLRQYLKDYNDVGFRSLGTT